MQEPLPAFRRPRLLKLGGCVEGIDGVEKVMGLSLVDAEIHLRKWPLRPP